MNIITVDMLKRRSACSGGIGEFREAFGESVEVTEETFRAHPNLDYSWAAEYLLDDDTRRKFNVDRAKHRETLRSEDEKVNAAYEESVKEPRAKYHAAGSIVRDEFYAACDKAEEHYRAARAKAVTDRDNMTFDAGMTYKDISRIASDAYSQNTVRIDEEYRETFNKLRVNHYKKEGEIRAEFEKIDRVATDTFSERLRQIQKTYSEETAAAFARAYLSMTEVQWWQKAEGE